MDTEATGQLLAEAIDEYAVPGAQVGLLRGGERTVVCAGVRGVEDTAPVTPSTSASRPTPSTTTTTVPGTGPFNPTAC